MNLFSASLLFSRGSNLVRYNNFIQHFKVTQQFLFVPYKYTKEGYALAERRMLNFRRGGRRGPYFKVLLQTPFYPNCTSPLLTEDKTSLSCRGKLLLEGCKKRQGFKGPMQTPFLPYLHSPILITADRVSLSCRGNLLREGQSKDTQFQSSHESTFSPQQHFPPHLTSDGANLSCRGKLFREGRSKNTQFQSSPQQHFPLHLTSDRVSLSCRGKLIWQWPQLGLIFLGFPYIHTSIKRYTPRPPPNLWGNWLFTIFYSS